jgi:hypothetical protein
LLLIAQFTLPIAQGTTVIREIPDARVLDRLDA